MSTRYEVAPLGYDDGYLSLPRAPGLKLHQRMLRLSYRYVVKTRFQVNSEGGLELLPTPNESAKRRKPLAPKD
jgi:hypothetical protein